MLSSVICTIAVCLSTLVSGYVMSRDNQYDFDVVVYGGTSGGFASAIQLARLNRTVALIEPSAHFGGIAVDGFGGSDVDSQPSYQNSLAIGSVGLEFYRRIAARYGNEKAFDTAWANHTKNKALWRFESHVAEESLMSWLKEYNNITLFPSTYLKQAGNSVIKQGTRITSVVTDQGQTFSARVFIDATIEGDLLAAAGVSTTVGRESSLIYGEQNAGIRAYSPFSQLNVSVDPYVIPGNPSSGLIPTVQSIPFGMPGSGDKALSAYVFRMCLTNVSTNLVPFTKPDNYNATEYLLYSRYVAAGGKILVPEVVVPNSKTDTIGSTTLGLGFDLTGRTSAYPEGDWKTRNELTKYLAVWQKGQLYFFANDPSMPLETRTEWSKWGYAKDEFTDNDNFPRRMYVRDGRRMVKKDFVFTAQAVAYPAIQPPADDPIAVSYWPTDVHMARRVVRNGSVQDEGSIFRQGPPWQPAGISLKAMIPMRNETSNLMSPTVMAVSHLGYGAIRIENTFMNTGQAAAFVASIAIERGIAVADTPYSVLQPRLLASGAVLNASAVGLPDNSLIT